MKKILNSLAKWMWVNDELKQAYWSYIIPWNWTKISTLEQFAIEC